MPKVSRIIAVALLVALATVACRKEKQAASSEPETFTFTVYPGARYLSQLTELAKQAHTLMKPGDAPPPTAFYDTDASLEDVAKYYVKAYGYPTIAADATNNLSAAKPPAYYRSGDLHTDAASIADLLKKLNLNTDVSKAQGKYRAVELDAKPNRPRVTIQRPYFDVTNSQVVDRTIILMAP
jgi:hypothetical protein